MITWADQSVDVRDRLEMLVSAGTQGLLIVFVILSLFLDLKIASLPRTSHGGVAPAMLEAFE